VLVAIGIARTRGSAIRKILTAGYRRQVERVEKTRLVVGSGEAPLIVDCVTYVETHALGRLRKREKVDARLGPENLQIRRPSACAFDRDAARCRPASALRSCGRRLRPQCAD